MTLGLGTRIALFQATLVAILAAVGAEAFLRAAERALDAEMTSRAIAVTRMASLSVDPAWSPALTAGAVPVRSLAEESLRSIVREGSARRALLLGPNGAVLASSDPEVAPGTLDPALAVDGYEAERAWSRGVEATPPYRGVDHRWYQSVYLPLGVSSTAGDGAAPRAGVLVAVETVVAWREPLERLRRAVFVFATTGVLAAVLLGFLTARGITRPLGRLAQAMQSVAPDGLPPPAGVRGSDEVGSLGARFDGLLVALRRKDAELRALSATVAHEVRNPLAAMSGYAELIERKTSGDADLSRMSRGIREEIQALERLVGRFLLFAGDTRIEKRGVELGPLLEESIRAAVPPGSSLQVERQWAQAPLFVRGDPDRLREVFVNLLRNAVQAARARVTVEVRGEGGAEVRIIDDGPGIDPAIRERLFQPFATTKAEGTGLGLAISRRLVTAHGGSLTFQSSSAGTEFTVRLPREEA